MANKVKRDEENRTLLARSLLSFFVSLRVTSSHTHTSPTRDHVRKAEREMHKSLLSRRVQVLQRHLRDSTQAGWRGEVCVVGERWMHDFLFWCLSVSLSLSLSLLPSPNHTGEDSSAWKLCGCGCVRWCSCICPSMCCTILCTCMWLFLHVCVCVCMCVCSCLCLCSCLCVCACS